MGLADVLLEALQLKVDAETVLSAYETQGFLVLLLLLAFLTQLRELVDYRTRKDLKEHLLSKQNVCQFEDKSGTH